MAFYFFPGLHLSRLVRKNRWDLDSVHSLLPGVLPRSLLQGTDIPSNSIWVGCGTFEGRVYGCGCEVACGHLQPRPSPVPRDPAASPAASPSLVTASVFCLLTLSWRSPSAGWWMGVSLSLGCSMQPGGLITSEFLVGFFSTGGGEWLLLHFL